MTPKCLVKNRLASMACGHADLEPRKMLATFGSDFDDGSIEPFETNHSERVGVTNGLVSTRWSEEDYLGTNITRKAEFRPYVDVSAGETDFGSSSDLWVGFDIYLDNGYMANSDNTDAGLMQIWDIAPGDDDAQGWVGMLKYDSRDGGQLTWVNHHGMNGWEDLQVTDDFSKGEWHNVVVRTEPSSTGDGV